MDDRSSPYNWDMPLYGSFNVTGSEITFLGGTKKHDDPQFPDGIIRCDQVFAEGSISADVVFDQVDDRSSCELLSFYKVESEAMITAGVSNEEGYGFRYRKPDGTWEKSAKGPQLSLQSKRRYRLEVKVHGIEAGLWLDGELVRETRLPNRLKGRKVGICCGGSSKIVVSNFRVEHEPPRVFAAMQFSEPYNEFYSKTVRPVFEECQVNGIRADETRGATDVAIERVEKLIREAHIVVAEVTPPNPNVSYEIGYARAIGTPTLLIADEERGVPKFFRMAFDCIYYKNDITASEGFQKKLKENIMAILRRNYDLWPKG